MVAIPVELIVATTRFEEIQVAVELTSCVVASVKVAIAVNCCLRPAARVGEVGVTAMDVITAGPTLMLSGELTPPDVAVMVAAPADFAVIKPAELTVAIAAFEVAHVAVPLTSWVVLSV